jgi:Ca2+-binding EF-hand superfamily protein
LLNAVREEHKVDTQREMNTLFEETDKDGDGKISFHEFVEMMKEKDYA